MIDFGGLKQEVLFFPYHPMTITQSFCLEDQSSRTYLKRSHSLPGCITSHEVGYQLYIVYPK